MQVFIDLDLRQVIASSGNRSPLGTVSAKSQDTLELDVYFVRNGVFVNPGAGSALKFGMVAQSAPTTILALQTSFAYQTDSAGNPYFAGFLNLNTSQMATAIGGTTTGLACNAELRYELTDGEIIHTLSATFLIFQTILVETGVTPPTISGTYPDSSTLELLVHKNVASGYAGLDGSAKIFASVLPSTVELNTNKNVASGYAGLSAGSLLTGSQIPIDGTTITLSSGVLKASSNTPVTAILGSTIASFTVPAVSATQTLVMEDTSQVQAGETILIQSIGYYTAAAPTDVHNVTVTNLGVSGNAAVASVIASGQTVSLSGPVGATGPSVTLTAGTITSLTAGSSATASVTGTTPALTLNLGIPRGTDGATPTFSVGTVSTLSSVSSVTVTVTGTAPNYVLNFGIPQGASGAGSGDMLVSQYAFGSTSSTHPVDRALKADAVLLAGVTGAGTSAGKDTPVSGSASAGQVVNGADPRLSDQRIPTAHASSHLTGSDLIGSATTSAIGLCPIIDGVTMQVNGSSKLAVLSITKSLVSDLGTIGTAAALNVPASGNATAGQVVTGADTRLTGSIAFDPSTGVDVYEEFLAYNGGAFDRGWTADINATSGNVSCPRNTNNAACGVAQMIVGTTATDLAAVSLGDLTQGAVSVTQGTLVATFRINVLNANQATLYLGLAKFSTNHIASAPTDGLWIRSTFGLSAAGLFVGITSSASSNTSMGGTSLSPVNNTWYTVQIKYDATNKVGFFVNGSQIGNYCTTNIPTSGLSPFIGLIASVGSTTNTVSIDYFRLQQTFSR